MLTEERDALLKALEEQTIELTKSFENYRQTKSKRWPAISEDGNIEPKDRALLSDMYWNHKAALEKILECADNVKKAIVDFESFFEKSEEQKELEEHISKVLENRKKTLKKTSR
jgi:hypothetical protein